MKITSLYALGLLAILSSCSKTAQNSAFELKGKLENSKGETLYFEKLSGMQPVVLDSAVLNENGEFAFEGDYAPKIGIYRVKLNNQNFAMLVLDSSDKVRLNGDAADLAGSYKVEGSPETSLFLEYNALSKARDLKLDSLQRLFQSLMEPYRMDKRRMDSLSSTFEAPYGQIVNDASEQIRSRIETHLENYASLMAIQSLDPEKYMAVYLKLDEGLYKKYAEDKTVRMFHDMVMKMKATGMGQLAPEIALPNPDGKEIALSSLRGKIVLIDFWASWCGPCRKEMPNVVKAYAKFKNKGFEIYGVSLDQDKDRWVEAIAKDGITWPQVSDLKYWESAAAREYNVQSIPYTVLLDREGKIIDKNLRGEQLEKRLAELLN